MKHNIVVPLRIAGVLTGDISVDNLTSGRPIHRDGAAPLLALANQLSATLENQRLREKELIEQARLEVLVETARALNSTLDQDAILGELATRLVAVLRATSATFFVADVAARHITQLAHHSAVDAPPITVKRRNVSFDDNPHIERILQTHTPYARQCGEPDLTEEDCAYLRTHGLEAEVLAPVSVRRDFSGLLQVCWKDSTELTPAILALCSGIAEQAGMALVNAWRYATAADRAMRDPLTNLHNHRAFLEAVDAEIAAGRACALLLIDVDKFKRLNDTYGHVVGDAVLVHVATVIQATCRDHDLAGRYGGDEFAVLLRRPARAIALQVSHRLMARMRAQPYVTTDGTVIDLTISVGAANYPLDGHTRDQLIVVADAAMYAVKRGNLKGYGR
jgi:diguanylate cyclase (GGDEF)-like protein